MAKPPRRLWQEMTTRDFAALPAPERVIAVLPVGSVEQHGPHLPLWTDSAINQGILEQALARLPDDLTVLVLPALPVGLSTEHWEYPGTLTLSPLTLVRLWTEIGESVDRAGIRKLVLFNSHGGQTGVLDIVARDLRARLNMFVVKASWFDFGVPEGLFPPEEVAHGIHGGAIETSMMLHLRPDLVRRDEARTFEPLAAAMEREFRHLRPTGRISFGWQAQDLNPYGVCGDAREADADRGARLVDHAAQGLAELLMDVDRFPLDALKDHV